MSIERKLEGRELPIFVKVSVTVIGLLVGFLDETHRGRVILAATGAWAIPVVIYYDFWTEPRFWITVSLLAAVQVPVVMAVRSSVEQMPLPALLAFGIADCLFIILVISRVIRKK